MTSLKTPASPKVSKAARDLSVDQIAAIILANSRYEMQLIQAALGGEIDLASSGRIAKLVANRLKAAPQKTDQRILSHDEFIELSLNPTNLKAKAIQFAKSLDPDIEEDKEAGPFLIDICHVALQEFTATLTKNFASVVELGTPWFYWTLIEESLKISEKTGISATDVLLVPQFNRQITKILIPDRNQYIAVFVFAIAKPFDKNGFVDRVVEKIDPQIRKFSKKNGLDLRDGRSALRELVVEMSQGLAVGGEEAKVKLVSAYEKEAGLIYGK